jgi:hypothetical protein
LRRPVSGADGELLAVIQARRHQPQQQSETEACAQVGAATRSALIVSARSTIRMAWFCARNGTVNIHSWFLTGLIKSTMVGMIGSSISTLM